jgi:hypothetical protein
MVYNLQDFLAGTVCDLVPGRLPWGPGYYLIAANDRVEAGPFPSLVACLRAMAWMDDHAMGVHPAPWTTRYSRNGLLIGSRIRDRLPESFDKVVVGY